MEKRWISLYVENEVGVLAMIAGLFSAKAYNLHSLTVGTTEDKTISRITIGVYSDDQTYEQIKKQLNRCIEVIKVLDFTNMQACLKELIFIRLKELTEAEIEKAQDIFSSWPVATHREQNGWLIESVMSEEENDELLSRFESFSGKLEVVRGGSVGIEL